MDEKRYIFETVEITDDNGESRVVDVITDKEECYSYENLCDIAVLLNGKEATIQRLEKENDRLRQQLKTKVIVNRQYEEKERLKKENRVLKKDLNKLYNLLIDKGMSHNELQDVLW